MGERYRNDGITKNFEYDAIITGTSMTMNFSVSEFNELFSVNSIRCSFAGARFKEVNENLKKGLEKHDISKVIWCLDYNYMLNDKDESHPNIKYPYYLTNDNVFDDVNYLFNKDIFRYTILDILRTFQQKENVWFDIDTDWPRGKNQVLKKYERADKISGLQNHLSDAERKNLCENLEQNVLSSIIAHPETDFYLFFPPYSICYWDDIYRNGNLNKHEEMERYVIERVLEYDNVHLYSFNSKLDIITNLDNYMDILHYVSDINSEILKWIKNDDGLLTHENYEQYLESCYETLGIYDYDSVIYG